ncbi:MAG: amidase [Phenylobacterium sp. RIFCSPHIGHO2_01_FULL_69_31]|uniref:amidase n=1 Tax=Phenylobacterium sp. RIFCSPHIGHO2_01_FULL_69_31 TaxID=1801944 RepID=UPI0008BF1585|nr:amidase [Phenylobacterium sp. RIFCSPHIGHO2_01_FULL_69_31]OHB27675.1 MAG: amidase [Phenylobacterium sp. RIFCSPHIGHO2_01_FULL_69_31]
MIRSAALGLALTLATAGGAAAQLSPYASAGEQQAALTDGRVTSEQLVRGYLERIERIDRAGPKLNAVLALNPKALDEARRLDAERRAGKVRGPLHGLPILLKDNIETADGTPTTAGSLALAANAAGRDAPLVTRLTDAGAIVLGKTNLSEWANFRGNRSISGWSAVGGLVRNPYSLDRTACGSSSGSGAAVAAGLAAFAVGTETDGSITCPAAMTGVVGLKPTVGLVSRTHIVPISPEQDTAGPMTRTVADAAAMLNVIAGTDPTDPATREADARKSNYLAGLKRDALKGARIGVWFPWKGRSSQTDAVFETALQALRDQGAVLVDVKAPDEATLARIGELEGDLLRWEFKAALDAYLATTPAAVKSRTLADLIAFNRAEPRELALFGQEIFEAAQAKPPITDPAYREKRTVARKLARDSLDRMLSEQTLDAIVSPSGGPPSIVDPVNGGPFFGSPSRLPAVSGYPHLTVPAGYATGLPVGLSFLGPEWSEARLLALGYAFEQATRARREPEFLPEVAARPDIARAYDPR